MTGRAPRVPAGFVPIRRGRLRGLVRADVSAVVLPLLEQWAAGRLPPARPLAGGRGGVGAFALTPDVHVVLRPYRRGGLVRHVASQLYCGVSPRPLRELRVTEHLRARGVPTLEPLAAGVHWVVPGCYRGALVSRELPLAVNLWQYLRAVEASEREQVCREAAAVTRRLHDAGAVHPDLNLQNYLVQRGPRGREVLIIDCDRTRLRRVTTRDREAAFARICRSIRRLDPTAEVTTLGCIEALRDIALPAAP